MSSIFVSYRRNDAPGHAGRIYDRLVERFGATNVYMDLDSTAPGADFVEVINSTLAACDALIAVIGRDWKSETRAPLGEDASQGEDWVQREIATALERNIRVIPVLVEGARMPGSDELPEDIKGLARRQAIQLADTAWGAQLNLLIDSLAAELSPARAKRKSSTRIFGPARRESRERRVWQRGRGAVAALVVCGLVLAAVILAVNGSGAVHEDAQAPSPRSLSAPDYRARLINICAQHRREAQQIQRAEGRRRSVYGILLQFEARTVDELKALRPPRQLEPDHQSVLELWDRRLSLLSYYYERFRRDSQKPAFKREFQRALRRVNRLSNAIQKRFTRLNVTPECNIFD